MCSRKKTLPRNYFRMIPIAGQIKTALSAAHADRPRGGSLPKDQDATTPSKTEFRASGRATMLPREPAVVSLNGGEEGTAVI